MKLFLVFLIFLSQFGFASNIVCAEESLKVITRTGAVVDMDGNSTGKHCKLEIKYVKENDVKLLKYGHIENDSSIGAYFENPKGMWDVKCKISKLSLNPLEVSAKKYLKKPTNYFPDQIGNRHIWKSLELLDGVVEVHVLHTSEVDDMMGFVEEQNEKCILGSES